MGWFWDSKSSKTASGSDGDAYSNLDSGLRDFLDKESSLNAESSQSTPNPPSQSRSPPDAANSSFSAQLGLNVPGLNQDHQNTLPKDGRPAVPPESLYQDGRYAHLWETYKPQAEIEAESRSDQDKLSAVYETLSNRRAAIGRAALENCVEEQMMEKECFKSGTISQRMTMCRTESRAFNRCFSMQSRFLKALGYLSSEYTTAENEEKIQMHADKLYHEMLKREQAMNEAKASGLEKPVFQPLIQSDGITTALGEDSAWARAQRKAQAESLPTSLSGFPPEKQKEIKERIRNLNDLEREVELQLIAAESRAMQEYTEEVERTLQDDKRRRAERKERGRETAGDTVRRLWGSGNR